MSYLSAMLAPPRFQWDATSGTFQASQSNNCGPTCMSFIGGFYNDKYYSIEALRRTVTGCCKPTQLSEQRDMLTKIGVSAQIYNVASVAALKSIISSGSRPAMLRIYMARVPSTYRGHPFTGWHAVVAIANGSKNGVSGIWVNDPNFSPPGGYRPDPARGHRFYPDWVINSAFVQNQPAYAIVPLHAKPLPSASTPTTGGGLPVKFHPVRKYGTIGAGINVRTGPSTAAPVRYTTTKAVKHYIYGSTLGATWNGSAKWYLWWSPDKGKNASDFDGKWVYVNSTLVRF